MYYLLVYYTLICKHNLFTALVLLGVACLTYDVAAGSCLVGVSLSSDLKWHRRVLFSLILFDVPL